MMKAQDGADTAGAASDADVQEQSLEASEDDDHPLQ